MGYTYEQLIQMGATPGGTSNIASTPATTSTPKKSYTYEELIQMGGKPTPSSTPAPTNQKYTGPTQTPQSARGQVLGQGSIASDVAQSVKPAFQKAIGKYQSSLDKVRSGEIGMGSHVLRTFGSAAGVIGDVTGKALESAFVNTVPQEQRQKLGEGLGSAIQSETGQRFIRGAQNIAQSGIGQRFGRGLTNVFGGGNKEIAKENLGALGNIASVIPIEAVGSAAARGTSRAVRSLAPAIERSTLRGAESLAPVVNKIPNPIRGAGNLKKTLFGEKIVPSKNILTGTVTPVAKDNAVREFVRQGGDEVKAEIIKNARPTNQPFLQKMYQRAEDATYKGAKERPSDITGEVIVNRLKKVEEVNKKAGEQLDSVAESLKGQKVDYAPVQQSLNDQLSKAGVSVGEDGLDFAGSDFEGVKSAENAINTVYQRIADPNLDAQGLHRLKRFIDNQVDYGKTQGGLSGQAERLLKGLRKDVDSALDSQFSVYKETNDAYSSSKKVLDSAKKRLGNAGELTDELKSQKAGDIMRRLHSNSPNRADLEQLLNEIDDYTKSVGYDDGVDLDVLNKYSDLLEDIFGTQATTGLQGQVERAVSAGADIARGNLFQAINKGATSVAGKALRLNPERKAQALRALTGLTDEGIVRPKDKLGTIIKGGVAVYGTKKVVDKKKKQ